MNHEYLKENIDTLRNKINIAAEKSGKSAEDIKLIAVSKNFPSDQIDFLNKYGQLEFGENKVQELSSKAQTLALNKIEWHLIGHLQSNKVKHAVEFAHMIQSVDSFKLAESIHQHCEVSGKTIDILVQVNTSGEDQKSGCQPEATLELCEKITGLSNINLRGLMTIGKLDGNESEIRANFQLLKKLCETAGKSIKSFDILSMGMTSDYEIAIEEGANMLRIGSAIFGNRNYI